MALTYYTLDNLATGDVLTETWVDEARTNDSNLIVPPMCIARRNAAQTISNNSETEISFDTQDVDTDGMFAPTSTDVTIQTAGVYLLSAVLQFSATVNSIMYVQIKVDGSVKAKTRVQHDASTTATDALTASTVLSLAANAVVTMEAFQTNSASGTKDTTSITQLAVIWQGLTSAPA